jgi:hypothetical protein
MTRGKEKAKRNFSRYANLGILGFANVNQNLGSSIINWNRFQNGGTVVGDGDFAAISN